MAAPLFYIAVAVWGVAAVWVSVTDWREGRIPKVVVWSAALVVSVILLVVSLLIDNPGRFGLAVLGGAAVGAFLTLFYFLRPGVIGFGDVRLVALNGLLGGWWGLEWAWGSLFAGVFAMLPVALVKALLTAWAVKRQRLAAEDEAAFLSEVEHLQRHDRRGISVTKDEGASPSEEHVVIGGGDGSTNFGNWYRPPSSEEHVVIGRVDGLAGSKDEAVSLSEETEEAEASNGEGVSGEGALRQAWRTTLRAGPWLCAGTAAVVVYRWVEVGVL